MKKFLLALAASCMITGVANAAPGKTWSFSPPTNYEDGQVIQEQISYNMYCDAFQGGPYQSFVELGVVTSPFVQDMAFVVQGIPGQYYCVMTALSAQFGTESNFSNEVGFTVTANEIGLVPLPPVLLGVQ